MGGFPLPIRARIRLGSRRKEFRPLCFHERHRLCYLGPVLEVRLCKISFSQCSATNSLPSCPELFSYSSGWLPVPSLPLAVKGECACFCGWVYGVGHGAPAFWLNRRLWSLLCRIGFRSACRS